MIHRFYVHNFRSLENFELPIAGVSSALLIGKNGAGKSSVGFALELLQKIGRGINRVGKLMQPQDMSHGRTETPVRFEIEVDLEGVRYAYSLALELPSGFRELRVLEESLQVGGIMKFSREVEKVRFPDGNKQSSGGMTFDWHLIWLSVHQARSERDPVHQFREWLARMILLRPYPLDISGDSWEETLHPCSNGSNLGAWWSGLMAHAPAAYAAVDSRLKILMPDLKDIKNPLAGKDSRSLVLQFDGEPPPPPLPFVQLSDGEKCMVIWALVMAANEAYGPLFCFWDEPDNYLAISEIGDFTTDLRRAFSKGGQFLATSHNAETIRRFADDNTFLLSRRTHQEPTQIRSLASIERSGDVIRWLKEGDIVP